MKINVYENPPTHDLEHSTAFFTEDGMKIACVCGQWSVWWRILCQISLTLKASDSYFLQTQSCKNTKKHHNRCSGATQHSLDSRGAPGSPNISQSNQRSPNSISLPSVGRTLKIRWVKEMLSDMFWFVINNICRKVQFKEHWNILQMVKIQLEALY